MAFEEMTCPNCGAALEFKTGTPVIVCKFCNTTLRLKAEIMGGQASIDLNPRIDPYRSLADVDRIRGLLKENRRTDAVRLYMEQTGAGLKEATLAVGQIQAARPTEVVNTPAGPFAVDLDEIERLLRNGQKINAIKLLREQTGLGLKEAKDAVDAIERGQLPSLSIDQRARPKSVIGSNRGCLLGCLPVLAVIGLCFVSMMLMSQVMFRVWGPYDAAMSVVRGSEEVTEALGAPLNTGLVMTGGISSSGSDSHAQLETAIFGSRRSGTLRVSGSWRKGRWDLSIWVLYDEDNEARTIYLSAKP
ncbi:MAG: ribosomal protein L7/L12 [Chloroflexi bacterium]|nr:ribosomal protein L7/L12 [Chloroflexota bacterium]